MDQAAQAERMRREAESSRKRPNDTEAIEPLDAKRVKLEHAAPVASGTDELATSLVNFDFTTLPVGLVADIVVANLQMLSEQTLASAIDVSLLYWIDIWPQLTSLVQAFRLSNSTPSAPAVLPLVPVPVAGPSTAAAPILEALAEPAEPPAPVIKEEPLDPLQMVMDDDLEYEPDRLNNQLEVSPTTNLI